MSRQESSLEAGRSYLNVTQFVLEAMMPLPIPQGKFDRMPRIARRHGVNFVGMGGEAMVFEKPGRPDLVVRVYHNLRVVNKYGIQVLQQTHDLACLLLPEIIPPATFFEGHKVNVKGEEITVCGNIQVKAQNRPNTDEEIAQSWDLLGSLRSYNLCLLLDPGDRNFSGGKYVDTVVVEAIGQVNSSGLRHYLLAERNMPEENVQEILSKIIDLKDSLESRGIFA